MQIQNHNKFSKQQLQTKINILFFTISVCLCVFFLNCVCFLCVFFLIGFKFVILVQTTLRITAYTYSNILEQRIKEKRSLSFSKRDRQTLQYRLYVKWSDRYLKRFSKILDLLLKRDTFRELYYTGQQWWGKQKHLAFSKQCCWLKLLVTCCCCCCCMLLIWHLFMQKETSRSFRKIVDFVPILKHFQGQIIFFYICYMVKKQNFQTKICVLVNLQNLTLTSIS